MNMTAALRSAWRALRANPLRSLLTMLGIIIGVAAVITMIAIGQGATERVQEHMRVLGANVMLVLPGSVNTGGVRQGAQTALALSEADRAMAWVPKVQVGARPLARDGAGRVRRHQLGARRCLAHRVTWNGRLAAGSAGVWTQTSRRGQVCAGRGGARTLRLRTRRQVVRLRHVPCRDRCARAKGSSGDPPGRHPIVAGPFRNACRRPRPVTRWQRRGEGRAGPTESAADTSAPAAPALRVRGRTNVTSAPHRTCRLNRSAHHDAVLSAVAG